MPNRFWIGGSGTWNTSTNTHWSTTSGGSNDTVAPTTSDRALFDEHSGGGTVTVSGGVCNGIFYASADTTVLPTISSGTVTITSSANPGLSASSNGTGTFSSNITVIGTTSTNISLTALITFSGTLTTTMSSGTLTLSNWTGTTSAASLALNHTGGTVTFSNNDRTVASVTISGVGTRTVDLGTNTITLAGTGNVWNLTTPTNLTLTASSSTLAISDTSATGKTFVGNGKTYGSLQLPTGASNPPVTVTGANTFGTISQSAAGLGTLTLPASTTTTVTTFSVSGTAGNLYTLNSSSSGTAATLSKASGAVNSTSLSIKDSTASGGAVFNARFSTSVSGNTGWNFVLENYSKIKLQAVNRAAVW